MNAGTSQIFNRRKFSNVIALLIFSKYSTFYTQMLMLVDWYRTGLLIQFFDASCHFLVGSWKKSRNLLILYWSSLSDVAEGELVEQRSKKDERTYKMLRRGTPFQVSDRSIRNNQQME